jgi:hypothetical protein
MEVSSQLHASAALPPGKEPKWKSSKDINWIEIPHDSATLWYLVSWALILCVKCLFCLSLKMNIEPSVCIDVSKHGRPVGSPVPVLRAVIIDSHHLADTKHDAKDQEAVNQLNRYKLVEKNSPSYITK